jgi:hypothetical protein
MPTFAELAAARRALAVPAPAPKPDEDSFETFDALKAWEDAAASSPSPAPAARAIIAQRQGARLAPTPTTTPVQAPRPEPQAPAPVAVPAPVQAPQPAPAPAVVDLSTRAMLVDLTVKMWSGSKLDREVTQEVAIKKNASAQSGRYTKNMVPIEYLEPLKKIANAAGDEHRKRTAAWGDNSRVRIIAAEGWDSYQEAMSRYKEEWQPAVDYLVNNWDTIKEAAKAINGDLYQEYEYPTAAELADRYDFDYEVEAVPTAGDFRVALGDIDRQKIERQIERRMAQKAQEVNRQIVERITETVGHMADRLRKYTGTREGAFRDTLVPNVESLIDLIPSLNVTGDARLTALAAQMRADLCQYTTDDLRGDHAEKLREDVATKAEAILAKVKAIM